MNEKEKTLLKKILEMAGEMMSNHVCNDPPDDWFADWTPQEIIQFDKEANEFNGTPEEHDPKQPTAHFYDWFVTAVLASKL